MEGRGAKSREDDDDGVQEIFFFFLWEISRILISLEGESEGRKEEGKERDFLIFHYYSDRVSPFSSISPSLFFLPWMAFS